MLSYAITDPSILNIQSNIDSYLKQTSKMADMVLYRDKNNPDYDYFASIFIDRAREYPFDRVLLHRDIDLAQKLKADGIHLASNQFNYIKSAKDRGLFTIISTHSIEEALKAQDLGVDAVTLSPIFYSPHKGNPLGIEYLKEAIDIVDIPIIALGGIVTQEHVKKIEKTAVWGFASIRYFINKNL